MNLDMQKIYEQLTPEQKAAADMFSTGLQKQISQFDWAEVAAEEQRQKSEAIARGVWTVDTKIADDGRSVEISAVIQGSHGEKSWGWHDNGKTKHVVLRVASLYQQTPVLQSIIALAEDEARRICRLKN